MKNKKLIGLLGAAVVMTAVSGCSSKKEPETEADTLVISDMEVIAQTEVETDTEKGTEAAEPVSDTEMLTEPETEAMTLELAGEGRDSSKQVAADSGNIVEPEEDGQAGTFAAKEGETGTESESETEIPAATGGKQIQNKRETEHAVKPQSETQAAQTDANEQSGTQAETQKQSETQAAQTDTNEQSGTHTESTEVQTEEAAEAVTEEAAESEPETEEAAEAVTEEAAESEPETEEAAETVTEEAAESELETEEAAETVTEEAAESEPETEEATEAVTEEAAESESETEEVTEADAASYMRVVSDRVNVREAPSLDGAIKALLTPGMQVLAVREDGEWAEIRYESENGIEEGYIKSEYLQPLDSVYITIDKVNVRAEASTEAEKLGMLEPDVTVIVKEQLSGGWSVIRYTSDTETKDAYVKTEFLEKADAAEIGSTVVREAESLLRKEGETLPDETESEAEEAAEAAAEAEPETEEGTEAATEAGAVVSLLDGAEGQFELAKLLLPELQTVGIIYSADGSETQAEEYTQMAANYGVQVVMTQIEQEIDIDLAASELVGEVDCVFCIDDELVNTLVQTVRAYADEMGIPVIGAMEQQVVDGCVAAYDADTLYWNTEEAGKLGYDVSDMNFANIKEY